MNVFVGAILVIGVACIYAGAAIQARKPWAWYAGFVIQFLTAGGSFHIVAIASKEVSDAPAMIGLSLYALGAMAVWVYWAGWWARNRSLFFAQKVASQSPRPKRETGA